MGIQLIHFSLKEEAHWGILEAQQIKLIDYATTSLQELLTNGQQAIHAAVEKEAVLSLDDVVLLSPVTKDAAIYCQGTNYSIHRVEAGFSQQKPPYNLLFTKAASTLTAADADIICPPHVQLLDYEIELGLVIAKPITEATAIDDHNLEDYVAGLVITNDVSARDVQIVEQQWFKGKSYRGFCPVGPYIYLLDKGEIDIIHNLSLQLEVNGEVRQQVLTEQLLFKPTETLSEMSEIFDLNPGDLVLTGTPGGVGLRLDADIIQFVADNQLSYDEKKARFIASQNADSYLKNGDVLTLTIKSTDGSVDLGRQQNKIVQAVAVK